MSPVPPDEVFTTREIARAAGVPAGGRPDADSAAGELSSSQAPASSASKNAPRTARRLRDAALALHAQPTSSAVQAADSAPRDTRKPAVASLRRPRRRGARWPCGCRWAASRRRPLDDTIHEETHLVFLLSPGPGEAGAAAVCVSLAGAEACASWRNPPAGVRSSVSEKPVITTAREESPKPTPVEPVIQPPPTSLRPSRCPRK